ncbi:unnamed protein product [Adineta steineri]|uniref:Uncharacterized protein n=1 Tax=Adineta steineri TaxID=433720 RepID=A0A814VPR1_9BILA|nr:unnamed protein product [Adineta steineri]CAF3728767.1 unnamed protein product [Adineta steineri]
MSGHNHIFSTNASTLNKPQKSPVNNFNTKFDETEVDILNDETFGNYDFDAIKIKSDFDENGQFLGNNLPDFFDTELSTIEDDDDQSQQPSIDTLLGEDSLQRVSSMSTGFQQSTINPLFDMAITQAKYENIFLPQLQDSQQINYYLKQFEEILMNQSIKRDIFNTQRNEDIFPMATDELKDEIHLTTMNINNSRSQSPSFGNSGMSSQLMDAIQRSDQISIVDKQQQHRTNQSLSAPIHTAVSSSPSLSSSHHDRIRHNRSIKYYPRPPILNTWQGRGLNYDAFAGMMSDREKQWVVKIQLHQVSQTEDEDYYFHQWSKQKHNNQSKRHHQREQNISYPVFQLLKSIEQEKELSQRISQTYTLGAFSNVNPTQTLPYVSPVSTQFGKQSIATPRHPRYTLRLDDQFSVGIRSNAITHDKYHLGVLLHIENIYRDILYLDKNISTTVMSSKQLLDSIIDRYLNHPNYLFADMFGQFTKGQIILERLYSHLIASTTNHLELILIRLYGSLSYMIRQWPTSFHIDRSVMNIISLIQQQIDLKKTSFEQLLIQAYIYYNEKIKPKILEFDTAPSSSPFSDPILFTNSHSVTILIELLLILERQCYLLSNINSSKLSIQKSQPQLSENIHLLINELCQGLIACSLPKKIFKPYTQIQQKQFNLLCKFLRLQTTQQIYASLEPKLIYCCIKDK